MEPVSDQAILKPEVVLAPALERGMKILEGLAAQPRGATLATISAELEAPKNSTLRLLQTLVALGYVVREQSPSRYRLTGKLLNIAHPRVHGVSLVQCSLDSMRALRDQTGETVQLGLPTGDEGVIIEKQESTSAIRIGVELGLRFLLHNNAPGKVLLAHRPKAERDATIKRIKLNRFTDRTITSRTKLMEECDRILHQGYATDWGEADEGIHCVAAPIRDPLGTMIATIWVSGIAGRMPKKVFPDVGKEVIKAAGEIQRKMQR